MSGDPADQQIEFGRREGPHEKPNGFDLGQMGQLAPR